MMALRARLAPRYPGAKSVDELRTQIAADPEFNQAVGSQVIPAPAQGNAPPPIPSVVPSNPAPVMVQSTNIPVPVPASVVPTAVEPPPVPSVGVAPAPEYVPPVPPVTGSVAPNPLGFAHAPDAEILLLREQLATQARERAAEAERISAQRAENERLRREVEENAAARRQAERTLENERRVEQLRNFKPPDMSRFSPEDAEEIQRAIVAPQLQAMMQAHDEEIRALREAAKSTPTITPEQIAEQIANNNMKTQLWAIGQQIIRDNPDLPAFTKTPEWKAYIAQQVGPARQSLQSFLETAERDGNHAYINSVVDTFRQSIKPPSNDILAEPVGGGVGPVVGTTAPAASAEIMTGTEYSEMADKYRRRTIDKPTWDEYSARYEKARSEGRTV